MGEPRLSGGHSPHRRPAARARRPERPSARVGRAGGHLRRRNRPGDVDQVAATLNGAVSNGALGLVVDLSDVPFLDSAGLRLLTRLEQQLRLRRQQLRLVVPETSRVHSLFMLTRLDKQLPLDATVEEAKAEIRLGNV